MPKKQMGEGFDGSRLRELRLTAGLTQKDLAARAGVNHISICQYETGKARPKQSTAERLWRALVQQRKEQFWGEEVRPLMRGLRPTLAGSIQLVCPHCGASSVTFSDVPGVEYKCISCSRSFKLGADGRTHIPAPPPGRGGRLEPMSAEHRANMSTGQRARHARERGEHVRPND